MLFKIARVDESQVYADQHVAGFNLCSQLFLRLDQQEGWFAELTLGQLALNKSKALF